MWSLITVDKKSCCLSANWPENLACTSVRCRPPLALGDSGHTLAFGRSLAARCVAPRALPVSSSSHGTTGASVVSRYARLPCRRCPTTMTSGSETCAAGAP